MRSFKLAIDCRFWGITHAGLGRYTRELVLAMIKDLEDRNWKLGNFPINLSLFFHKDTWQKDKNKLSQCRIIEVDIPHYSLREQLEFGRVVDQEKLDLVHFPHFNLPVRLRSLFVVTIHDLIKHFFRGRSVTTRALPVYWLKHWGYRLVLSQAVARACKIFVPSYFVKDQLIVHFPQTKNKIKVTYEGVAEAYRTTSLKGERKNKKLIQKYRLSAPFFVYTGSVYPFKDVPTLLTSFKDLLGRKGLVKPKLLITCARSIFWEKLKKDVERLGLEKEVIFPGQIEDDDLARLYQIASALVVPSLMEGFGLPGLEAMASGCPVIASRAGSLPEVYGQAAVYFQPQNAADLTEKLSQVLDLSPSQKAKQIEKGKNLAKKYSWEKTAQETLEVYKKILTDF